MIKYEGEEDEERPKERRPRPTAKDAVLEILSESEAFESSDCGSCVGAQRSRYSFHTCLIETRKEELPKQVRQRKNSKLNKQG